MRVASAVVICLVLLSGCGSGSGEGTVTVFAAASLQEAFEAIATEIEREQPGVDVVFNFAGSQQLSSQIAQGAPADVFASAAAPQMQALVDDGRISGDPDIFARNRLAIATEAENPNGITALADLGDPGLKVVLAADDVPVGGYARQALEQAGVTVKPVSLELDAKAVLSKVTLGEADAGIVYASDIANADGDVGQVDIADEHNVVAEYPIGAVTGSPNPAGAELFVDTVLSDSGQTILRNHGFDSPS